MSDPRNAAHDKKVKQEKEHEKSAAEAAGTAKTGAAEEEKATSAGAESSAEAGKNAEGPTGLERSIAVLSQLKEMEFHSRANIERLAGLTLVIDDELKQKEFSEPLGDLYSAQDGFQTKVAALIESYQAKCESLKATG